MIESNQIICFLTILEENSFSRAADALGIAQSAVSQKLRRLEDQLGICLIERTSRRLRLSQHGLEFLPFARQMVEAELCARQAARSMAERSRTTLRLGGYAFASECRSDLIAEFMTHCPEVRIEVEYGTRDTLLEMLRNDAIDAFLCIACPGSLPEFEHTYYRRLTGYLAVPANHLLSNCAVITKSDLAGLRMVISPGRQDAQVLDNLCRTLWNHGAELVFAPEAERRALALFARRANLPSLRWLEPGTPPHTEDGLAVIPVEGGLAQLDHFLYTRRGPQTALVDRICRFVRTTADGFGPCSAADLSRSVMNSVQIPA